MAEEKLIIDVQANDSLTPALEKAKVGVKSFADEAKTQFSKVGQNAAALPKAFDATSVAIDKTEKRATTFADIAGKKFSALGEAAIGIFSADVIARVFGFSSAIGAVSSAAQAAADGIRSVASELVDQLKPALADTEGALAKLKDLQQSLRSKSVTAPLAVAPGFTADIDLSRFSSDPARLGQAVQLVRQANLQIQRDEKRNASRNQPALFGNLGSGATTRTGASAIAAGDIFGQSTLLRLTQDLDKLAASTSRAAVAAQEATRAQTRQADFDKQRTLEAQRQLDRLGFGRREGVGLFAGETPLGGAPFDQAGFDRFQEGRAIRGSRQLDLLRNRNRSGVELFGGLAPEIADNAKEAIAPVAELANQTQRVATFSEQVGFAFADLGKSIQENLGNQAVFGTFNAFSSFFERAIQGQATLRDLGRSFVALGAQILSQQAAFRLIGFLFGGFGFGVGSPTGASQGGFAGFNGGSSGGSGVPLPLMSGGGGGSQVAVSLNVASLDPRNAAEVILAQMPAIQRGLAAAIVSGQSRNLRMAVGSV